ncbi:regulator of G-protein signaling 1 [Ambystoma mexicanum]|uniref:regulator of G-protein signaling 1 n=1 Tax=Ambystoma mexicanum TaxID=8296 RepID=UPI0037E7C8C4
MPGIVFTHTGSPVEPKPVDASLATEPESERRKPRSFMDLKAYLKSLLPHLESGMKPSDPKSESVNEADAAHWPKSLERLLDCHTGRAAFHVFLKSEYSDENLDFWLACEDYKKDSSSETMQGAAERIYKEFIQADARRQVNLDYHTRQSVAQKVREATASCFDEAQRTVYVLMERDSYPRFLKSNAYLALANRHQGIKG